MTGKNRMAKTKQGTPKIRKAYWFSAIDIPSIKMEKMLLMMKTTPQGNRRRAYAPRAWPGVSIITGVMLLRDMVHLLGGGGDMTLK